MVRSSLATLLALFACSGTLLRAAAQQAPQYVEVTAGSTDADGKNVTIPAGAICTLNRYGPTGSLGACVLTAAGDGSWQLLAKANSNGSLTCGALCSFNVTTYRASFPAVTTYAGTDYRKVLVTSADTPFCGISHLEQTGQFGGSCAVEHEASGWTMTLNTLSGEPLTCGVVCYSSSTPRPQRVGQKGLAKAVSKGKTGSGLVTCGGVCLNYYDDGTGSEVQAFQQLASGSEIFTIPAPAAHSQQFAHCGLNSIEFLGTQAASCEVTWNNQVKTWIISVENN
eukprot:TRINITY_DN40532_c0_g1_i1.p1 TRINITY_DN40532_c0_g1~~TRINITY_DN40532_c0_g1_i1.p1  ORF type:complete len:289 (-),score=49.64 TRINITY_DN40532_c0_g1_i1:174-1019(-)